MGARRSPTRSWIHSTLFFTLLSYSSLIPGLIIILQPGPGSSASLSKAPPIPRIILVRDPVFSGSSSEDVDLIPDNLIPRFNIPSGNLSQQQRTPYWEAMYVLKYGKAPPSKPDDVPYNKTAMLRTVLGFQALIRDSLHNRGSIRVAEQTPPPSEMDNNLPMPEYGKGRDYGYRGSNDIDTEGVFTKYGGSRRSPSFYPIDIDEVEVSQDYFGRLPTLGSLLAEKNQPINPSSGEMISNYVPTLRPSPPKPRPISSRRFRQTYRFPFPLFQIRYGFNRRPRGDQDLEQRLDDQTEEQSQEKVDEDPNVFGALEKSSSGESDTGESKISENKRGSMSKPETKPSEQISDEILPPSPPGYHHIPVRGDPRKHYNPFELLRKFLIEQDSSEQGSKNSDKHFKVSASTSSGMGNVFLKNLVSRSSGGGGGGGHGGGGGGGEEEFLDGDPGPRGNDGRKFQTQGW